MNEKSWMNISQHNGVNFDIKSWFRYRPGQGTCGRYGTSVHETLLLFDTEP